MAMAAGPLPYSWSCSHRFNPTIKALPERPCPIREPSRVVRDAGSTAGANHRRTHAEIPVPPTEPTTAGAAALPGADAGDVRRIQRVEGEVQRQYSRHGRAPQVRRHGRDEGGCDGRPLRRSEGDRRWIHDRLRRQRRAGDRSGEGEPRGDVAGIERRGTGDPGGGWFLNGGREPGNRSGENAASGLVEHCFRHEYDRLVALLTRKVGVRHLDLVEDAVQGALMAALTAWTAHGRPDDPGACVYRVAFNNLMGHLRQTAGRHRILERAVDAGAGRADCPAAPYFAGAGAD